MLDRNSCFNLQYTKKGLRQLMFFNKIIQFSFRRVSSPLNFFCAVLPEKRKGSLSLCYYVYCQMWQIACSPLPSAHLVMVGIW